MALPGQTGAVLERPPAGAAPPGACHTRNMRADIVIIGGGIIGSSIAYHLARTGRAGDVVVIECDPTCEDAATTRSNGGLRRLFSLPENIEMASFGLALCRDLADMHEPLPFLKTETDLAFRPEGAGYVGGVPDWSGPPGWSFSSPPRTSKTSSGPRSPGASWRWSLSGSGGAGAGTSRAARSTTRRSPGAGRAASRTSCSRTGFPNMASCTRQPPPGAWRSSSWMAAANRSISPVSRTGASARDARIESKGSSDVGEPAPRPLQDRPPFRECESMVADSRRGAAYA